MKLRDVTIYQKSDWDGFFGLFTNNITNLLVLTGLLLFTVKLPKELVFGRILPGVGLGVFLASMFYFYSAYKLAKKEKRDTVTALPSGISVPHMFLIIYMIVLPVNIRTGNPVLAWQAGLAWCFIEGAVEACGAFLGKFIQRAIPRAALLGSLAGVSITFIMTNGALQSWEIAYISFASFAVILLGFVAKIKMPFGLPAGLMAIVCGTILGWISGYMSPAPLIESISTMGFYPPIPAAMDVLTGMREATPFLMAAIPMGIYNFMESIDNLESAAVAGDRYNTTQILLADGVTSMIGAMFGSPVPTAVYIGHPGWKSIGAKLGYSWMTGIGVLLVTMFGLVSVLINVIPVVALLPILIYIGMLIGSQAFEHIPKKHFPAVILSLLPWLADWGKGLIGNAASTAGVMVSDIAPEAFQASGIYYRGFEVAGSGAIIIGVIWGSLLVFMLERKRSQILILCLIAAVLSFFGVIHEPSVGIVQSFEVVAGYLLIGAISWVALRFGKQEPQQDEQIS